MFWLFNACAAAEDTPVDSVVILDEVDSEEIPLHRGVSTKAIAGRAPEEEDAESIQQLLRSMRQEGVIP